MVVKAFDGSRRMMIGGVDLHMVVGPHTFMTAFQVMDINPGYNCLLVRPWIYVVGTATSTHHQKLKFMVGDKIIVIEGENDMLVRHLTSFRYIEAVGETLETPFQALDIPVVSRRQDTQKKDTNTSS